MFRRAGFYYAGSIIVLALLLGGGTMQALWTDRVLQLALIPALFLGLGRIDDSRWSPAAKGLAVLTILIFVIHLLPLGRLWPTGDASGAQGTFFSVAASRTVESMLVYIPMLSFALYVSRFTDQDQERLLRFVIVGVLVNLGVGAFQLSASGPGSVDNPILPYQLAAGVFANPNHFSAMVVAVIPLLAYYYLRRTNRPLIFAGFLTLTLLYLFAVGSRAGVGVALCAVAVSVFMMARIPHLRAMRPILVTASILAAGAFFVMQPDFVDIGGTSRGNIFATTFQAIRDHWILGTGIGSFESVYPFYENPRLVTGEYVNHAHNEFLEIWLETGVIGLLVLAAFFGLVLLGAARTSMATAFTIAILAIAAHGLVDYPTRTMAIGILLAYFSAHVLSAQDRPRQKPSSSQA